MRKKLFNKILNITTSDNKKYTIENKNIFIHGSVEDYTYADIMLKDNNLYIIKEIYSYEDNRLRFFCTEYINPKINPIGLEKDENGNEKNVMIVENYDRKNVSEFNDSIGNITELISDIEQEKHKELPKILKFKRKNKNQEDLLKVA